MARNTSPLGPSPGPSSLLAVAVGGFQVILAWTEDASGGLGFRIERADNIGHLGPFLEIGKVGQHVAAFRDGSVMPRRSYAYRVRSWSATGDSPPSNMVEVTTPQAGADRPIDQE